MNIYSIIMNLYFAFIGAYLSVVLARVLRQNGTVLKKMDEGFRMMGEKIDEGLKLAGEKIDEGFKLIARLIVEENEKTRKEILEELKKK